MVHLEADSVSSSEGFSCCARHFSAGILSYFKEKRRGTVRKDPLSGALAAFRYTLN